MWADCGSYKPHLTNRLTHCYSTTNSHDGCRIADATPSLFAYVEGGNHILSCNNINLKKPRGRITSNLRPLPPHPLRDWADTGAATVMCTTVVAVACYHKAKRNGPL